VKPLTLRGSDFSEQLISRLLVQEAHAGIAGVVGILIGKFWDWYQPTPGAAKQLRLKMNLSGFLDLPYLTGPFSLEKVDILFSRGRLCVGDDWPKVGVDVVFFESQAQFGWQVRPNTERPRTECP
jgi:hypothetical protein